MKKTTNTTKDSKATGSGLIWKSPNSDTPFAYSEDIWGFVKSGTSLNDLLESGTYSQDDINEALAEAAKEGGVTDYNDLTNKPNLTEFISYEEVSDGDESSEEGGSMNGSSVIIDSSQFVIIKASTLQGILKKVDTALQLIYERLDLETPELPSLSDGIVNEASGMIQVNEVITNPQSYIVIDNATVTSDNYIKLN